MTTKLEVLLKLDETLLERLVCSLERIEGELAVSLDERAEALSTCAGDCDEGHGLCGKSHRPAPTNPPPKPGTGDVWAEAIALAQRSGVPAELVQSMNARRALGIERYGTVLQRDNGRDFDLDLFEELLDGYAYAVGSGMGCETQVLNLLVKVFIARRDGVASWGGVISDTASVAPGASYIATGSHADRMLASHKARIEELSQYIEKFREGRETDRIALVDSARLAASYKLERDEARKALAICEGDAQRWARDCKNAEAQLAASQEAVMRENELFKNATRLLTEERNRCEELKRLRDAAKHARDAAEAVMREAIEKHDANAKLVAIARANYRAVADTLMWAHDLHGTTLPPPDRATVEVLRQNAALKADLQAAQSAAPKATANDVDWSAA